MNIAPLGREAKLEDLFAVEGKAELVDGRLALLPMTGGAHGDAVMNIVNRPEAVSTRAWWRNPVHR